MRLIPLLLLLSLFSVTAQAIMPPVEIDERHAEIKMLVESLEFLVDETGQLGLEQLNSGEYDSAFTLLPSRSLPVAREVIWLRFQLHNSTPWRSNFILSFEEVLFESISVNYRNEGQLVTMTAGMDYAFDDRLIRYRYLAFPLAFAADETQTIYVRIYTSHFPLVAPIIGSEKAFLEYIDNAKTTTNILLGVLIGVFSYVVIIAFGVTQSRDVLHYMAFLATTILINFFLNGYFYQWFPGEASSLQYLFINLMAIANIFNLLFARHFLETYREMRMTNRLISVLVAASVALIPLTWLLEPGPVFPAQMALSLTTMLLLFVIGFNAWRLDRQGSGLFLGALVLYLLSVAYAVLGAVGIITYSSTMRHSYLLGAVALSGIFAFALARKLLNLNYDKTLLQQRATLADAESKLKGEFLAKMSHEIRTPINGVLGMAQILSDSKLDTMQRRNLDVILGSGRLLLDIVNDILDYSKIEAGGMVLEKTDFHVDEVISQCLPIFMHKAKEKSIDLKVIISPELPLFLIGDPTRIKQILNNLMSNAIKFTQDGYVTITADILGEPEGDEIVMSFAIADSGIGISEQQQRNLFQSFQQADSSTTRKFGGTGLGLTISRQLAQLMDGDITVVSEEGVGSNFIFKLRCKINTEKERVRNAAAEVLKGKRVLTIFDRPELMTGVDVQVIAWGMEIYPIYSLDEASPVISEWSPDLIFIISSAIQSGSAEREMLYGCNTPVLILQSIYGPPILDTLAPAEHFQMLAGSNSLADIQSGFIKALGFESFDTGAAIEKKIEQSLALDVLVAEDNSVNQIVIKSILEKLGATAHIVHNGKEAVDYVRDSGEGCVDLLFMDCEMPVMDGYAATQAIRKLEQDSGWSPLPIIALTAHALQETHDRCLAAGMNDVVTKPIVVSQLRIAMQKSIVANNTTNQAASNE